MRLGVLDIGSNTVHLLIADLRPGGRPLGTTSERAVVRLMRFLTDEGTITPEGVQALSDAAGRARKVVEAAGLDELLVTATSAIREAANGAEVIAELEKVLGQPLEVLDGDTEARLTFLAVRRWFGWASGHIRLFDIGGGSLELAAGADEMPELTESVPLGAGRMTLRFLDDDAPGEASLAPLRMYARELLTPVAERFGALAAPDHVVGTSKTIASLARLAGYPVAGWTGSERLVLSRASLGSWIPRLARLPSAARAELPGISSARSYQIVAGAVVLHTAMEMLAVTEIEVCPWALREGVLLRYIESMAWD